jgi:hypothetical protein
MGATLVRNTFCPTLDYGLSYYFGKNNYRKTFIKASISSFVRFAEISTDRYKAYNNSFVNIEIGGESSKKDPNSRFYKSSLGLGYKLLEKKGEDRDPTMSKQMYRLFFHYYVNNYLVITPEFATSFKKSERDRGWFGVGVALQVF